MSEFKAGDRVRTECDGDGTIVALSLTQPGRYIVEFDEPQDCRVVACFLPKYLTPINDAVTVTVEMTREQASAVVEKWWCGDRETPSFAAAGLVVDACREALR